MTITTITDRERNLVDSLDQLKAKNRFLAEANYSLAVRLESTENLLAESRANDLQAMTYLADIRDSLGFVGDFPALVAYCAEVRAAVEKTILQNLHLCDGDDCTLKTLRDTVFPDGIPGDEEVGHCGTDAVKGANHGAN